MLTFSEPFYSWCIFLALQIAKRRGDSTLKPQEMLRRHFEHELFVELPKATFPEDEIPDVLYYGACLVERGCSDVLPSSETPRILENRSKGSLLTSSITQKGLPKAVEIERSFIRVALSSIPAFWQSISAFSAKIRTGENFLSCSSILSDKFQIWKLSKAV